MVATVDRALDTAAPRLAQALRAVQRSHWAAAASHHRAVGDAALLYARAVAVARTIGVASSMATARMGAVAAYRVAAALGDRSFSTFDSLRRDLQATTAKSAIALAEVGQHERAAKMLRQAIFMSPGTETQKASSRILGWSMHHLNRYDEATEAFSSSAAWNYFRIAGSLNDEDSGCDIDVAYLPHQLVGGEVWFADFLREVAQHVGRSERCTELFAGAGFIGFALLAFGLCNSLVVADIAPEAMASLRQTVRRMNERGQEDIARKVSIYRTNVLDGIPVETEAGSWDLVVGYPPDVAHHRTPPSKWSTAHVLTASNPGYVLHQRLFAKLSVFLAPGAQVGLLAAGTEFKYNPALQPGDVYLPFLPKDDVVFTRTSRPCVWSRSFHRRHYYFWVRRTRVPDSTHSPKVWTASSSCKFSCIGRTKLPQREKALHISCREGAKSMTLRALVPD